MLPRLEIVVNLHMHTRYSDGAGSHRDIVRAALRCGLDAVIVTDHNVWVRGIEGYITDGSRRLLVLVGEEVHDQDRLPQKDHLLVLGANREVASLADDTALLLEQVQQAGGLSFIAHLDDPAAPAFKEKDISWVNWSVQGFTGIELWNSLSELKTLVPTKLHGVFYAFFPSLVARGPSSNTLRKWDQLISERPTVAIGGSDAHAMYLRLGPLGRVIFPYDHHFKAINTHVLIPETLSGDPVQDARTIYTAIAAGHCFVGYDLPRPTRGFRFEAQSLETQAIMGDQIDGRQAVTLQVKLPSYAEIRLMKDGETLRTASRSLGLTHRVREPGAYRIEAYVRHLGRRRGWIFSNPIYVV